MAYGFNENKAKVDVMEKDKILFLAKTKEVSLSSPSKVNVIISSNELSRAGITGINKYAPLAIVQMKDDGSYVSNAYYILDNTPLPSLSYHNDGTATASIYANGAGTYTILMFFIKTA